MVRGTPPLANGAPTWGDRQIAYCVVSIGETDYHLCLHQCEVSLIYYVRILANGHSPRIKPWPPVACEANAVQWHVDLIMLYHEARKRSLGQQAAEEVLIAA